MSAWARVDSSNQAFTPNPACVGVVRAPFQDLFIGNRELSWRSIRAFNIGLVIDCTGDGNLFGGRVSARTPPAPERSSHSRAQTASELEPTGAETESALGILFRLSWAPILGRKPRDVQV